jgi:hypothetical protein
VVGDAARASGLSKDGHALDVTTEGGTVALDPLHRLVHTDIKQATTKVQNTASHWSCFQSRIH